MEKESDQEAEVYLKWQHCAVCLKLTQHYKSTLMPPSIVFNLKISNISLSYLKPYACVTCSGSNRKLIH